MPYLLRGGRAHVLRAVVAVAVEAGEGAVGLESKTCGTERQSASHSAIMPRRGFTNHYSSFFSYYDLERVEALAGHSSTLFQLNRVVNNS
ncbi:hypothetical protein CDAR_539221 [Caerostris darwini]|uniref:Secreted protein n=1 Tax=Caerostris darwini TaxID=1538125 RepID=A0AAV4T279_9ARAC|nr:hypothetical protein CDAR_539221 [Caerostris darwini]